MKNILLLFLIATVSLLPRSSEAQSKEDFLSALSVILDLDETQLLYQHYQSSGKTLIILKPSSRNLGAKIPLEELLFDLRDDDFWDFSGSVRVMTKEEAAAQQIPEFELVNLLVRMNDNEMKFIINSALREENLFYSGNFSVSRESEDDDWEVTSRDFRTQKNR